MRLAPKRLPKRAVPPLWQRTQGLARLTSSHDFEAATARLLTQGGDTRLALNAQGFNPYGCAPRPDASLVQLGSCTGSVISAAGFAAAVALFRRLYGAAGNYHQELARQRQALLQLCGAAQLPGTELVFAASGTDVHVLAVHLAAQRAVGHLQAVMVEAAETGSGVPDALSAVHFATQTAQGQQVQRGAPLAGLGVLPPLQVRLRHSDGSLRSQTQVDADFSVHVTQQIAAGGSCLLVLVDSSKTGLQAPSLACAAQLQRQYGERLTVLVDACQWRMSHDALLAYLKQDFLVALTGSKFMGGPAFCGALLLPPGAAQWARAVPLQVVAAYSARSDWPQGWKPARALAESPNLGLLLRWEAALIECQRFMLTPQPLVRSFLQSWHCAVQQRLDVDHNFAVLPIVHEPGSLGGQHPVDGGHDPSIFTFQVLKHTAGQARRALNMQELRALHAQLRDPHQATDRCSQHFLLGQPVPSGGAINQSWAALRLCSSARMVTEAVHLQQPVSKAIEQAMRALDQVVFFAQALR